MGVLLWLQGEYFLGRVLFIDTRRQMVGTQGNAYHFITVSIHHLKRCLNYNHVYQSDVFCLCLFQLYVLIPSVQVINSLSWKLKHTLRRPIQGHYLFIFLEDQQKKIITLKALLIKNVQPFRRCFILFYGTLVLLFFFLFCFCLFSSFESYSQA